MKERCRFLVPLSLSLIFLPVSTKAQILTATTAPAQNWVSLAASSDGTRLAAAASYGWIYVSTNAGTTWQAATTSHAGTEPQRPWTGIAGSADGNRLVAVANFVPIFTSTNGGLSWAQNGPAGVWSAVAASSDGLVMAASDYTGGFIYTSRDGGVTWNPSGAPQRRWRSIVTSADGSHMVAAADYGTNVDQAPAIFCSTNFGDTWHTTTAPSEPWQSLASSADGKKLAAGAYGGLIYLSGDAGRTWKPASVPNLRWGGVAASTDGTRLAAAAAEGKVYVSADSGQSWSAAIGPVATWQTVASSADGTKLYAGIWDDSGGGIYTAQLAPTLNIKASEHGTVITWEGAASGFALEESTALIPGSWRQVTAPAEIVAGQNQVVIDSSSGNAAYRLVRRTSTQP